MDIAKIRKKAREKEKKDDAQSLAVVEEAGGKREEAVQSPQVETGPEAGIIVDEPEEAAGDNAVSLASSPAGVEYPGDESAGKEKENPPPEAAEDREDVAELLTFSLSKEEFAFRVSEVEEIVRHQRITKVPTMPDYVLGITSLRGKIIPVIDLKTRIVFRGAQGDEAAPDPGNFDGRMKILILLGPKGPIGATVDGVMGVVRLPRGEILEPPAHLLEEERKFVDGVVILDKRFVSIVRCEEALKIEAT